MTRRRRTRVGLMALAFAALLANRPGAAGAHLFHSVFEPRDNQLTRDYLVVVRLIDFPQEKFPLAEEVYRGQERVRLKPGGVRSWLHRPSEPGMVFKADYQLHRWAGSLEAECRRLDRAYGTSLHSRIEAALHGRNAEAVKAAFRQMFVYLIRELLNGIDAHLGEPAAAQELYEFASRYFTVAHEAFLNVQDRQSALIVRASLDAAERALGDAARGLPPAPEFFEQQRARVVKTLEQSFHAP